MHHAISINVERRSGVRKHQKNEALGTNSAAIVLSRAQSDVFPAWMTF